MQVDVIFLVSAFFFGFAAGVLYWSRRAIRIQAEVFEAERLRRLGGK